MINQHLTVINQIKEIYAYFSSIKAFRNLVPEVRTNISGALSNATNKNGIAAIEGRITVIGDYPKACGDIKFGVSDHTARLLLTARKFDAEIHFVMNLKYESFFIEKIENQNILSLREIQREKQPDHLKKKEHSTMQWLIKECYDEMGVIPDIIWDKGAMGKEPMIRLFSKNAEDMISKLELLLECSNVI
ncbi:MAG: hypothetical protein BAJALOKI1v1_20041 [Promethearchaeota archaeon]|nr:MAG: hypothetical protein BAJALOKI1v1_20041 [Candidatus Lokiarchaeota archaeon]